MIIASALYLTLHSSALQQGLARRGSLGLSLQPVPAEQQAQLKIKVGEGFLATKALPGLTAEQIGVREGDVFTTLNGKPANASNLGILMNTLRSGEKISLAGFRDGKPFTLGGVLVEKPRDPGNANYEVIYSDITSFGKKMRTIITMPKKPGKYPGFLFIQGFFPISYDYKLEGSKGDVTTIDGPLLYDFANSGFVTIRVEKPGVGDSEGGPFAGVDFTTELDIYRQTLKQLKDMGGVDKNNIFIFGHSMGGAFGPMIAAENPVKGIATYGTASRTWIEYFFDIQRYQSLLAGASFEQVDESVRLGGRVMNLVFTENLSPEQVKKAHPELAATVDGLFPGGLFSQKTSDFWRQLAKTNFPAYWAKTNARVLSVRGASDYVTYDADHKLIADVVNKVHPGWGKFVIAPSSDHLFHNWVTEADSLKGWTKGQFNNGFTKIMMDWIREVMAEK